MLSETEITSVEKEIEKYIAIKEYLDDNDKEFIKELKEEMDQELPAPSSIGKKINRKIIKKIISLSLATILACVILIPMLYISVSSLLGRVFRVDATRFSNEQNFTRQFISMAFPQVKNTGGSNHTEFYNQKFVCSYIKGISNKAPSEEIEVNYSFGKLKKPTNSIDKGLQFFEKDKFYAINSQTYFKAAEWNYLEKAPDGTKAQISITFKSKLSPQQAFTALGKQYFDPQKGFDITMLADIDSEIVLGNMDPASAYEANNKVFSKQDELDNINKFNAYDNDVHKQVLLYGLNQIKNHKNITDYITVNYSATREKLFENIDESISYVEKNGVQYVGALITGDTKELLKLKDNLNISDCTIEDLVVW